VKLSLVECRACGSSFWVEGGEGGSIASGPCCFGHFVLSIEDYPSEYMARKGYPVLLKRREATILARTAHFEALAKGRVQKAEVVA